MKGTWVWLLIAGVFGWVWWSRSKQSTAKKTTGLPEGAVIGQIGSRIESPEALKDFARGLALSASPRIVFVRPDGDNYYRNTWSDGRVTITDAAGTVYLDNPFIPSP